MIYSELYEGIRKKKYKYYSESDMFTVKFDSDAGNMIFQFLGRYNCENLRYFKMITISFEDKLIRIFRKSGGRKS